MGRRCYDDGQPWIHAAERRLAINGEAWAVWEDMRDGVSRSLIFESTRIARRIYGYPRNWLSLPDGELYALSWSR